jgi:HAD superfamily hydrolase (TIGR01509 family)
MTAVLFDMDGTLTDSIYPFDVVRSKLLSVAWELGLRFSESQMTSIADMVLAAKAASPERFPTFHRRVYTVLTRYDSFVNRSSRLAKGVQEVLVCLSAKQVRLGVVTNSARKVVKRTLERNGVASYFDVLVTRENVIRMKPYPDPVIRAMKILGADPADTFFVGDSWVDVMAGNAASVKTVYIGSKPVRDYAKPWRRLDSLMDLCSLILPFAQ